MDSTLAMAQRLADDLEAGSSERFEIMREIRGDWQN
jgi:hypothetical protein